LEERVVVGFRIKTRGQILTLHTVALACPQPEDRAEVLNPNIP
jgi:hypothetical protein